MFGQGIATPNSPEGFAPSEVHFPPADVVAESLLWRCTDAVTAPEGDRPVVRCPFVNDVSAEFVPEGAEIKESVPERAEVIVSTAKISQLVRVTRELLAHPNSRELLADSVKRSIVTSANEAFINQPVGKEGEFAPPPGILNVKGILDGGTINGNLDVVTDTFATIEANNGTVTHILASPDAWASLRKLKTAQGASTTLLGAGTEDATRRLLGVEVITSPAVPKGTIIAIDKNAIVAAAGPITVTSSEHRYFEYDSIALRATWRFGQNLVRPNRVAKLTIGKPVT